jgi:hypothetical protein
MLDMWQRTLQEAVIRKQRAIRNMETLYSIAIVWALGTLVWAVQRRRSRADSADKLGSVCSTMRPVNGLISAIWHGMVGGVVSYILIIILTGGSDQISDDPLYANVARVLAAVGIGIVAGFERFRLLKGRRKDR